MNVVSLNFLSPKYVNQLKSISHLTNDNVLNDVNLNCFVYFHLGVNAKSLLGKGEKHLSDNCNSLIDDYNFIKAVEQHFKICVNVINVENIINSIYEFNNHQNFKLFLSENNPISFLINSIKIKL